MKAEGPVDTLMSSTQKNGKNEETIGLTEQVSRRRISTMKNLTDVDGFRKQWRLEDIQFDIPIQRDKNGHA